MNNKDATPQTWGQWLRHFRMKCRDVKVVTGRLTQGRLAELISRELNTDYPTMQAVAKWEKRTLISPHDRGVLLALLTVLHRQGGLVNAAEADVWLASGHYRGLEAHEQQRVFGEVGREAEPATTATTGLPPDTATEGATATFGKEKSSREVRRQKSLERLQRQVRQGPGSAWPRVVAWRVRAVTDHISAALVLRSGLWIVLWALNWAATAPSLRWPFADRATVAQAMLLYVGAALVVPALIAAQINTKDNGVWQARGLARTQRLRWFIHIGASMGYHIGYMGMMWMRLPGHLLNWAVVPALDWFAAAVPLAMAYWSALMVADNTWKAYGELSLRKNWMLFVDLAFGVVWASYAILYYRVLFEPLSGVVWWFTIMMALAATTVVNSRRKNRKVLARA